MKVTMDNADKVETTKARVLEAAKQSPEFKEQLKTLFPEVFEEDKYFDLSEISDKDSHFKSKELPFCLEIRTGGNLKNKAFLLDHLINWEIKNDYYGQKCLIPTKK